MRLAGHLKMTLGELGERMDADEYELWKEFNFYEPFGDERRQMAEVAASVFNAQRTKKEDPIIQPERFLPQRPEEEPAEAQDPGDQQAMLKAVIEALSARNKK